MTCSHGTAQSLFCPACFRERGGAETSENDNYVETGMGLDLSQQDIWDLRDQMLQTVNAIESLDIRFSEQKKNPPLFPEGG